MPNFKPTTTVYLCAGTGLDLNNTVWMHQYAYATENYKVVSWWNTLFQWFKKHSIAEGYWFYTYIDPSKGYVDVGRTPLSNGSDGQKGLGSSEKQAELNNYRIDYAEAIADIDYVVFANGDDGGVYDVKYGMVEKIEYINPNVARIYFIIDAMLTYQKYFELGRCFVDRDMEFNEWKEHKVDEPLLPTRDHKNTQPEAVGAYENDYVLQHLVSIGDDNKTTLDYLNLGAYSKSYVATDVELHEIYSSIYNSALPSFNPPPSSKVGDAELGIGVYWINDRQNEAFKKLGEYNAFDHILMSYSVPNKLMRDDLSPIPVAFCADDRAMVKTGYLDDESKLLKLPNHFSDSITTSLKEAVFSYKPINFKCYQEPLSYFSIADKQGASVEILPSQIIPNSTPTEDCFYDINLRINASVMPNIMSNLYIANLISGKASKEKPFATLWQVPTYQMTPNNSGYGNMRAEAMASATGDFVKIAVLGSLVVAAAVLTGGTSLAATAGAASIAGAGAVAGAAKGVITQTGSSAGNYVGQLSRASTYEQIGLPKAAGGAPTSMTTFALNNAGYEVYFCHLRTDLMKLADYMFSVIGYTQNAFRRPHINTRKRWCYVKLHTVNIKNIGGNNYIQGGTPFWARRQIEERLKNGVTFWNLRHALGDHTIDSYTKIPDSSINCKFVRNYGTGVESDIVKDNTDACDGYADDYDEERE